MKKLFLPLGLLLFSSTISVHASLYQNEREGSSFYIAEDSQRKIELFLESENYPEEIINQSIKQKNSRCAEGILLNLKQVEGPINITLKSMRFKNKIDDPILDILIKQSNISYKKTLPPLKLTLKKIKNKAEIIKSFQDYLKKEKRQECLADNYISFVNSLKKINSDITNKYLKRVNYLALRKKIISKHQFKQIESARQAKLHEWPLTIKTYLKKKGNLRKQFPVNLNEFSHFVSEKNKTTKKLKMSHRQKLYQHYTYYQIALMGNIIQKMRKRLDAVSMNINILYASDEDLEVITLDPMERFHFVLKVLRKEKSALATSHFFAGKTPSYIDIITAAYEINLVPAEEVEEVANLEEIWNPTKTKWEKISFWIRTFIPVATVVIPQPYGFLGVLAMVVLEGSANSDEAASNDHNLFR